MRPKVAIKYQTYTNLWSGVLHQFQHSFVLTIKKALVLIVLVKFCWASKKFGWASVFTMAWWDVEIWPWCVRVCVCVCVFPPVQHVSFVSVKGKIMSIMISLVLLLLNTSISFLTGYKHESCERRGRALSVNSRHPSQGDRSTEDMMLMVPSLNSLTVHHANFRFISFTAFSHQVWDECIKLQVITPRIWACTHIGKKGTSHHKHYHFSLFHIFGLMNTQITGS